MVDLFSSLLKLSPFHLDLVSKQQRHVYVNRKLTFRLKIRNKFVVCATKEPDIDRNFSKTQTCTLEI